MHCRRTVSFVLLSFLFASVAAKPATSPSHGTINHGTTSHGTFNHGTTNQHTVNHGTANHGYHQQASTLEAPEDSQLKQHAARRMEKHTKPSSVYKLNHAYTAEGTESVPRETDVAVAPNSVGDASHKSANDAAVPKSGRGDHRRGALNRARQIDGMDLSSLDLSSLGLGSSSPLLDLLNGLLPGVDLSGLDSSDLLTLLTTLFPGIDLSGLNLPAQVQNPAADVSNATQALNVSTAALPSSGVANITTTNLNSTSVPAVVSNAGTDIVNISTVATSPDTVLANARQVSANPNFNPEVNAGLTTPGNVNLPDTRNPAGAPAPAPASGVLDDATSAQNSTLNPATLAPSGEPSASNVTDLIPASSNSTGSEQPSTVAVPDLSSVSSNATAVDVANDVNKTSVGATVVKNNPS